MVGGHRGAGCFLLGATLRIPTREYVLKFVVQDLGANRCAPLGVQCICCFLNAASADHLIDRRFHERRANCLSALIGAGSTSRRLRTRKTTQDAFS
jgi:hypothetical protein